jgi:uncharacterized membrane protein YhaH (DUF805 family)
MSLILMALWVAAAVVLWKRAQEEGTPGWQKWLALVVVMPLIMFVIGLQISKHSRRR